MTGDHIDDIREAPASGIEPIWFTAALHAALVDWLGTASWGVRSLCYTEVYTSDRISAIIGVGRTGRQPRRVTDRKGQGHGS